MAVPHCLDLLLHIIALGFKTVALVHTASDTCKHPAQPERNHMFNVTTEKIIKSIESPVLLSSENQQAAVPTCAALFF